jgi:hypothetical protein
MMKRFQKGVRVGTLYPEYFIQYFSSHKEAVYRKRQQYIHFNGNLITTECPSYEFSSFDDLPGLNCQGNYAMMASRITHNQIVYHPTRPLHWFVPKTYLVKTYYSKLCFICNPITNMVCIDYEFRKELIDEQTNQVYYI